MDGGGGAAGVGGVAQPNDGKFRAGGWWHEQRHGAVEEGLGESALGGEPGVEIIQPDIVRKAHHTLPRCSLHRPGGLRSLSAAELARQLVGERPECHHERQHRG